MHSLLACRSDYSVSESVLKVKTIVEEAKRLGQKAVAITDTMTVTSLLDLSKAASKADIKAVIGARIRLVDDPSWRKPPKKEGKAKTPPEYFVTWYVLSEAGLKGLYRLLSLGQDDVHFYGSAKVSFAELYHTLDALTCDDVAIVLTSAYSVVAHPDALTIAQAIKTRLSASISPPDRSTAHLRRGG